MENFVFGSTASGLPIIGYRFGHAGPRALILGGVHGDEIEGVWGALGVLQKYIAGFDLSLRLSIVPMFNLDGVLARDRRNSHGVDLNRNLPTRDWSPNIASERYHPGTSAGSEAENQALLRYLESEKPQVIFSLHSWKPMLNVNGDCRAEAEAIASRTGYVIEPDIGYPTPGSLGTFAGLERGIPTITYEIERGLSREKILETHVPAIHAGLQVTAKTRTDRK